MGPGVIIVLEGNGKSLFSPHPSHFLPQSAALSSLFSGVDVLGRSVLRRMIGRFLQAEVEWISIAADATADSGDLQAFDVEKVDFTTGSDLNLLIHSKLQEHLYRGIEHSFVVSANLYAETDILDMFYFHREGRHTATRATDREGVLDMWVVDCAKAQQFEPQELARKAQGTGTSYFIREYVNRLNHPRDLRRLACDALRRRCVMQPCGREIKPGIWIDENADIHRKARVVAPAYIGRAVKLREDTLITRCSNIEEGCYVDYGTVIEDASILQNTHVGIWLDVCRAVVDGNRLVSLGRDAVLEISDPSILRSTMHKETKVGWAGLNSSEAGNQASVFKKEEPLPASESLQLGANFS